MTTRSRFYFLRFVPPLSIWHQLDDDVYIDSCTNEMFKQVPYSTYCDSISWLFRFSSSSSE